jgi:hypothetical protein
MSESEYTALLEASQRAGMHAAPTPAVRTLAPTITRQHIQRQPHQQLSQASILFLMCVTGEEACVRRRERCCRRSEWWRGGGGMCGCARGG